MFHAFDAVGTRLVSSYEAVASAADIERFGRPTYADVTDESNLWKWVSKIGR